MEVDADRRLSSATCRTGSGGVDVLDTVVVVVEMGGMHNGFNVFVNRKSIVSIPAPDDVLEAQPPAVSMHIEAIIAEMLANQVVDDDVALSCEDDSGYLVGPMEIVVVGMLSVLAFEEDSVLVPGGESRLEVLWLGRLRDQFEFFVEDQRVQRASFQLVLIMPDSILELFPAIFWHGFQSRQDRVLPFDDDWFCRSSICGKLQAFVIDLP